MKAPQLSVVLFVCTVGVAAETGKSPYGVLVDAPGAAITYGFCSPCHSERIIAQQGLSREGWDELLDWMTEEHGMADPPDVIREPMLNYLATYYGVDRPHFPAGKRKSVTVGQ